MKKRSFTRILLPSAILISCSPINNLNENRNNIKVDVSIPGSTVKVSEEKAQTSPPTTSPISRPVSVSNPDIKAPDIAQVNPENTQSSITDPTPPPISIPTQVPTQKKVTLKTSRMNPISCGGDYCENDISFVNFKTGWTVGDDGKISNTVDGGIRWNEKKVGVQDLFSVHFVDENNGWAAGREGIIYKTTDGGENWELIDSTVSGDIIEIMFSDTQNGAFIQNGYQSVFVTSDGGNTWDEKKADGLFNELRVNKSGSILAFGFGNSGSDQPALIDQGNVNNISSLNSKSIRDMTFLSEEKGFSYSTLGLFSTQDGGQSWEQINSIKTNEGFIRHNSDPSLGDIIGLSFSSNLNGVMVLRHFTSPALPIEYKIYFTIDGGENWVNSGVNIPLRIANRYDNLAEIVTFDENHQSWVMIYGGFNFLSNSSTRGRYLVRISN